VAVLTETDIALTETDVVARRSALNPTSVAYRVVARNKFAGEQVTFHVAWRATRKEAEDTRGKLVAKGVEGVEIVPVSFVSNHAGVIGLLNQVAVRVP